MSAKAETAAMRPSDLAGPSKLRKGFLAALVLASVAASCGEEPQQRRARPENPTEIRLRQNCFRTAEGFNCAIAAQEACKRNRYEFGEPVEQASGRVCKMTTDGRKCQPKTWLVRVACW